MSDTKLHSYITEQFPGGMSINGISRTFTFEDGTTVEVPTPFLPIGNDLVITPKVTMDGDKSLRFDLTRWCPGIASTQLVAVLPVDCDQATAVRVARAYHADPAASWTASVAEVATWMSAWGSTSGVPVTDHTQKDRP